MVKRMNCNRMKEDCNLFHIFSSFISSCLLFVTMKKENNHDCLVVMQSLYYKSSSKHILKSVRHGNLKNQKGTGTKEREREIQTNKSTII